MTVLGLLLYALLALYVTGVVVLLMHGPRGRRWDEWLSAVMLWPVIGLAVVIIARHEDVAARLHREDEYRS